MSEIITSKQDASQVLRLAFDDGSQSLRVSGGSIPGSMEVNQLDGTKLHVTVDTSALPAGAATSAKQDTEITALNNIVTTSGETATNTMVANTTLSTIATNTSGKATEVTLGAFSTKTASGMVTVKFDEQIISYVGLTDDISSIVYKLASVTVATQSLSYDGQGRLSSVVLS